MIIADFLLTAFFSYQFKLLEVDILINKNQWPETGSEAEEVRDRIANDKLLFWNIVSKNRYYKVSSENIELKYGTPISNNPKH